MGSDREGALPRKIRISTIPNPNWAKSEQLTWMFLYISPWLRERQNQCNEDYRLGDDKIESSPIEKELGVLVDENLDMNQQPGCVLTTWKAKNISWASSKVWPEGQGW